MDEAFSALDPLIRRDMQAELRELQQTLKKTIVFVSHDLDEAVALGGRIVLMKDGEVVQIGQPEEIVARPATDYVARFVEHIDLVSVIRVEQIVDRAGPVLAPRQTVTEARAQIRDAGDAWLAADSEGRLVGRVRGARLAAAGPVEPISALLDLDLKSVVAGTRIDAVLGAIAAEGVLAVVTADGRLIGSLTSRDVVRALAARPGSHGQSPGELSNLPQPTGAERWTGTSPNFPSTRSATKASTGSPTMAVG